MGSVNFSLMQFTPISFKDGKNHHVCQIIMIVEYLLCCGCSCACYKIVFHRCRERKNALNSNESKTLRICGNFCSNYLIWNVIKTCYRKCEILFFWKKLSRDKISEIERLHMGFYDIVDSVETIGSKFR